MGEDAYGAKVALAHLGGTPSPNGAMPPHENKPLEHKPSE